MGVPIPAERSVDGLAVDGPTGEVVVVGATSGALEGTNGGGVDGFVHRMAP